MTSILNNSLFKLFELTFIFLKEKTNSFNFNISFEKPLCSSQTSKELFFNAGQLLMLFYLFNITNSGINDIIFYDNTFYFNNVLTFNPIENSFTIMTAENIITDIINKSTYFKETLPKGINYLSEDNLLQFKNGFKTAYTTLINEKISILDYLNSLSIGSQYPYLIQTLKILNPHDLNIQLQFIDLKYTASSSKLLNQQQLRCCSYNKLFNHDFLDNLINNAIIGSGSNGMELMWLGYIDSKLQPIKYYNVYIAILFAYAFKQSNSKYYLQSAKNSINPVLTCLDDAKDITPEQFSDFINLLYLLNCIINYPLLNKYLSDNKDIFSSIPLSKKKEYHANADKHLLNYICQESPKVLNNIVLPTV